jgi:murein DD-endopeptidase MepM/ murein hydrolase activator NlpD
MKSSLDIFHLVIVSLSLFAACSTRSASLPAIATKRGAGIYHVVRPGENLFRIGKAYDVPFEELARLNGIKNASQIHIGQRIFIAGATRQLPVAVITPVEVSPTTASVPEPEEMAEPSLLSPISGAINSGFGPRGTSFHDGVDIAAPEGTPIRAIEQGEVVYSDQLRGYGNIVIIRHAGGLVSVYAHNQLNLVREGQQVARGEVIAKVGSTGRVTGPHLHFEIRKNNTAKDPLHYLPQLCCFSPSDMVRPDG